MAKPLEKQHGPWETRRVRWTVRTLKEAGTAGQLRALHSPALDPEIENVLLGEECWNQTKSGLSQ